MTSALFYLQFHSTVNRLTARFTRLKQPKYLAGAIVGGIYFYFYFFRYLFHAPGGGRGLAGVTSPETFALIESLGALLLFVIVLLAWVIPHERAALTFTEAEVAFLFPAPISRLGLIHFKLLRSQMRIFFTTLFLTLFSNRFGGNPWIHGAAWWLILSTLNLHFLGSSFARTMLLDRGISNWLRRLIVFAVVVAFAGVIIVWARRTMPTLDLSAMKSIGAISDYAKRAVTSGPALYLLYPFRVLARLYLARDASAFLKAVGPAAVIFLLHYVWVIKSNVAFEEASVEASQKLATRIAAARSGNWQAARRNRKGRRPPFKLSAAGPQPVALLWKNLISAGQAFTARLWIIILATVVGVYVGFGNVTSGANISSVLGILMGVLLGWSLLLGPQFLRQDLRQDLPLTDVLKTYPMPGWQIVLGEVLAPAAILAAVQWLLLILGAGFFLHVRGLKDGLLPLTVACGAAIVLPLLDVIMLLIPNAAVLLFPSWIQVGKEGPRGIEATGQRLIFMLGQLLAFTVALLPAALFFAGAFILLNLLLGPALAVLLASFIAAIILAAEAGLGVRLLGGQFERFDLSAELTA